jgi:hypothetical protein
VSRGIHQIQDVFLPVLGFVRNGNGLTFDGNTPLPLDVHVVQDLIVKIAVRNEPGALNEPIGESRLAMIDVGDDAEIADFRGFQCC